MRRFRCPVGLPTLPVLAMLCGLAVRPACAQIGPTGVPSVSNPASAAGGPTMIGPAPQPQQAKPAPAALPGAASREERVTPSHGGPIGNPTDALFDAVNRGDIAAVRTAIDHGADLNARDLLGMTALDESIDLNRNDITFLLLSLRGSGSSPAPGAPHKTAATTPHVIPASAKLPPNKPRIAERVQPKLPPADPPPIPQQFAGGGTPDPAVGFLGFGPSR